MSEPAATMRAVVCVGGAAGLRLDPARPIPKPLDGEVLLRVRVAGICDTDLQLAGGYMGFRGVLGHEFVGETEDGKRVTAEINNACGRCDWCRRNHSSPRGAAARHCPFRTVLGIVAHDGAMADWVAVPEANLRAIPDAVDDRTAVFIEPLAAALHIKEQVGDLKGMRCAVLGDGKLGLLCAWVLRQAGAETSWVGKHPAKLALGGSDMRVLHLDQVENLACAFEVVVDATGSTTGLPLALRLVEPCGVLVLKTTVAAPYEINLAPLVVDEVRVMGSRCGPFEPAIDALQRGAFDVKRLIEAEYPTDAAEEAFRAAAQPGARKVLLFT